MKLGAFEIQVVEDGRFGLDGGAMFGIILLALGALEPSDEANRSRWRCGVR